MTNLLQRYFTHCDKSPLGIPGGEYNQIVKPLDRVEVRGCFLFSGIPMSWGMSNLGDANSLRDHE